MGSLRHLGRSGESAGGEAVRKGNGWFGGSAGKIEVVREFDALAGTSFLVEAVVEHHPSKAALLSELSRHARDGAVLSTTTSSLSISRAGVRHGGARSGFVGLHVFNPVTKMKLVELVFPPQAAARYPLPRYWPSARRSARRRWRFPTHPGFVVNRLLFPYLFSAVEFMSETGMAPEDIDRCMTLGAGLPMGPIALLDFVGLDVAEAIGDAIGAAVPPALRALVASGDLGRKCGRGFFSYD